MIWLLFRSKENTKPSAMTPYERHLLALEKTWDHFKDTRFAFHLDGRCTEDCCVYSIAHCVHSTALTAEIGF